MAKEATSAGGSIEAMAQWLRATPNDSIPIEAIEQAKLLVLDTIGCGLAGLNEEVSHSVLSLVDEIGGREQCTIIGRARKASTLAAILANGSLVRVLDLNDYIGGTAGGGPEIGGHPSDNIPVALALGEARRRSGADVLASIVLGYEIFGRLKGLMDPVGTWDEVTISGLVAPAIAGRLMQLDEEKLAHALSLGAARAATPAIVRGGHISAAKSIANALVAQSGVQGALLAAHGATGPLGVLDANRSLHELFSRGDIAPALSAPLPEQPYILRSNVKMYPCLATGQSAVAAALKLHAMIGGASARLHRIEVAMADYPIVGRQQKDPERVRPRSREAADHSFNFLVAVTLIDGAFGLPQYENDRWLDPEVVALMERLVMTSDATWSTRAPGSYPCALRAWDESGKEYLAEIPYPPGFAHGRLDTAIVIDKFHALAHDYLPAATRERIVAAALDLDRAPSIAEFMDALRPAR